MRAWSVHYSTTPALTNLTHSTSPARPIAASKKVCFPTYTTEHGNTDESGTNLGKEAGNWKLYLAYLRIYTRSRWAKPTPVTPRASLTCGFANSIAYITRRARRARHDANRIAEWRCGMPVLTMRTGGDKTRHAEECFALLAVLLQSIHNPHRWGKAHSPLVASCKQSQDVTVSA